MSQSDVLRRHNGGFTPLALHNFSLDGESEQRLHELLNLLPAAVYTTDADGRITFYNETAAALWGRRPRLNVDRWCGSWQMYWPDGTPLPHDRCPMAVVLTEGQAVAGQEAVIERPDGTRMPFMAFPSALRDATGQIVGAVNMFVDITERKRSEEMAQRLASIVESSGDAIISKNLDGTITSWNKGAARLFGYAAEEIIGKPAKTLIPPDRQDEDDAIVERVSSGERIEHYETVRLCKDGRSIEISLSISPIRNAQGKIVGVSKIARDISERKRSDAHIAILAREAEHRARNVLATVQATVRLSQSDTPEGLKQAIEGRLRALANVHTLFVQSRWRGAELRSLITQELSPYCQDGETRVRIEGPDLFLEPNTAQTIAVTLHELATNAAKYGALSVPEGYVQIGWSREADGQLAIRWTESDGPAVKPPAREGFGTRVMKSMIGGQSKGEIRFDWREQGLACDIAVRGGFADAGR
jgi:PAS domain S-box-containing protein